MSLLAKKLKEYIQNHRNGKQLITQLTWVKEAALDNVLLWRTEKHKLTTINALYEFFRLQRDEWYRENLKKWKINTSTMFGEFFHELRIRSWKSIQEVASDLRNIDERTLERLENGHTFPYCNSYTIMKLIEYYGLNEEQKGNILWYLSISHEFKNMYSGLIEDVVGKKNDTGTLPSWAKIKK